MSQEDRYCYNCGKTFKYPALLERHKRRKTPCIIQDVPHDDIEPNRCRFCNKAYKQKYNLTKHYKTCVIKNGGMEILMRKVSKDERLENKKIEEVTHNLLLSMMDEIKSLRTKIDNMSSLHSTNFNTQNNAPHNFNNTIINNYLSPNVQNLILDPKTIDNYSNLSYAVLDHIYFNPERPENHSFYISNKKEKELMVYTNQGLLKPGLAWKLLTTDKDRELFVKDLQNTIMKEGGSVINNIYNNDLKQFEKLPKDLRNRIINFNGGERIQQRDVFQITLKGSPIVKNHLLKTELMV
jgi:hypothetical protein